MISVLTPSVRPEGLNIVAKALKNQTFKGYEWLIGSPKELMVSFLSNKAIFIIDPPKPEGYYLSLNRSYNKMIKRAKGDLIVSWQDFTYANPDALEKFWFYFTHGYESAVITGVGHKYKDESWQEVVWRDPRVRDDLGTFYQCHFNDIEINLASFPKKAFYAVGGFDEELDKWAGYDHISVQERLWGLRHQGEPWDFYIDQTQVTKSLPHGRLPHWEENLAMDGHYGQRKLDLVKDGKWPILEFLQPSPRPPPQPEPH